MQKVTVFLLFMFVQYLFVLRVHLFPPSPSYCYVLYGKTDKTEALL